jgi:hypothetical protein
VKGGQLAPFVVNPPQTMTFAEHEIRTILAFLDGYQKLGKLFLILDKTTLFRGCCHVLTMLVPKISIFWG